jgi:hypothetical protein
LLFLIVFIFSKFIAVILFFMIKGDIEVEIAAKLFISSHMKILLCISNFRLLLIQSQRLVANYLPA